MPKNTKPTKDLSTVKAVYRNLRSSPRKINDILRSIRGKKADIALRNLQFSEKRVSKEISKTIKSAVANAENNNQLDIDNLFIKEAYVGKGMVMKRYRPRARGRAGEIKKPFSNLTIIVSEKKETEGKRA
ncbi:MAG: 50S ribosomal protein L22 [Pelagibacteraceae bacterium]|jgi:large subunit ribosomal protein L22|uniref:50S ribosomal protein L22 n=1 Tax=Candidatus Pelagibacter sp. HIMB1517 TaxID=3413341 RepID=UPI002562D85E|nr:50S ribosomal protein L22 [Pelagibacteraceae bacterium]MCI5079311.1 50S ribosomal protein L22 [Pelagibacteraceae bacterium]|tara:strand:+ start:684 stop:1073 length:390 start_codon:yes stop_codon:yes gene_type:complete